jgi:hypothetical protein
MSNVDDTFMRRRTDMSKTKELLDAYWDTREQRLEADVQRMHAERDLILGIKQGLENLTFEEAVKIKAARGDPAAIDWLARGNRRQVRLEFALCTAAMDMHPERWLRVCEGQYIWRGEGEMPNVDATVEQFQKEHPMEARAIEAKIDAEGDA